jgi:hypothetical protein
MIISLLKLNLLGGTKELVMIGLKKRLDIFLVSKSFFYDSIRLRKQVSSSGISNHFPILIELDSVGKNPPISFNFNPKWLATEDFIKSNKD